MFPINYRGWILVHYYSLYCMSGMYTVHTLHNSPIRYTQYNLTRMFVCCMCLIKTLILILSFRFSEEDK